MSATAPRTEAAGRPGLLRRVRAELGRIRVRLLVVNLFVLIVPVFGLEFARTYERQLLDALERDMRDQAVLVRASLEADLRAGTPLDDPRHLRALTDAAVHTRTRIRLLGPAGELLVDSHAEGPPEGVEPPPPRLGRSVRSVRPSRWRRQGPRWHDVPDRQEVREALAGRPSAYTRVRDRAPGVVLFVSEPVRSAGAVVGVVYVTRSTRPVMVELYKIRAGLIRVLLVAVFISLLVTLRLAFTISRPLRRLSRAAARITSGERGAKVPVEGATEIRELAESLGRMTQELSQRADAMGEFAADVAHEFKSPLTSIRGATELLSEGAKDDPAASARFLANILEDTARLDRLVTRLLELSRLEASDALMSVFDLEAMVGEVVERMRRDGGAVELRFEAGRYLRGRGADLALALRNVLENALRYSPPDQPVQVVVDEVGAARGRRLRIRVRDRGPGIPEADRERVFDRFFTTDEARNGTGLGLAMVRSVVAAHGGRVGIECDDGTEVTMELPSRVDP